MNTLQSIDEIIESLKMEFRDLDLRKQPGGDAPYLKLPPDSLFFDSPQFLLFIIMKSKKFTIRIAKTDGTGKRETLAEPEYTSSNLEFAKEIRRILVENCLLTTDT